MKYIITTLISLILSSSLTLAHGGGHKKIKDSQIIEYSDRNISIVVNKEVKIEGDKLDKSWLTIPGSNKKIHKRGNGYYIITFKNDQNHKTLYILLSEEGELYNANYSGKFDGL